MKYGMVCIVCLLCTGWTAAQSNPPSMSFINFPSPSYLPLSGDRSSEASATGLTTGSYGDSNSRAPSSPSSRYIGGDAGSTCWVSAEYLLWWFKDAPTPPLVTTGPAGSNGILGQPGTIVLFGGSGVDLQEHQGARFTIGMWLDEDELVGVEGNYFFLGRSGASFAAASSGNPLLARPFFNASLNAQDSELVASPGLLAGGVRVRLDSQLQGGEANLLCVLADDCCCQVSLLAGFRYVQLDEGRCVEQGPLL